MHMLRQRRHWVLGLSLLAALLVGACGGGGGDAFYVTVNDDFATAQAEAILRGSASLPQGSDRSGGTLSMPIITCQLGPYRLTWSNGANGAEGSAVVLWDCEADAARWSAFHVPLAMGVNRITVTLSDSAHTAQAKVTVTRN
jgi:hypothetical protein